MKNRAISNISFALVEKNSLKFIRNLDERTSSLLQAYIRRENSDRYYYAILSLLKEAHEKGAWFACSCYSTLSQRALFAVRRLASNHLTLVRMTHRSTHHPLCPLWQAVNHDKHFFSKDGIRKDWTSKKPLLLYPRHETSLSVSPLKRKDGQQEKNRSNTPKLGRILFTFLEKANLQTFPLQNEPYQIQQSLAKAFVSAGYSLNELSMDLIYFSPKQIGFVGLKLKELESQWPTKSGRPFAFFLLKVEYFQGKIAYCSFKSELVPIEIKNCLRFSSGRISPALGPFWLLLTVTSSVTQPHYYVPYNGFAVPLYSDAIPIAVESHFERRVLEKLIQVQKQLKVKHSIEFFINKPLLDKQVRFQNEIQYCRPDFILKCYTPQKIFIVVEVMGSNDPVYTERKLRLKPILSSLGIWLEFDALTADIEATWTEKLDHLARQIYKILLDVNL